MTTAEAMQLACSICFVHQAPPPSARVSPAGSPHASHAPARPPTPANGGTRGAGLSRERPAVSISLARSLAPCLLPSALHSQTCNVAPRDALAPTGGRRTSESASGS